MKVTLVDVKKEFLKDLNIKNINSSGYASEYADEFPSQIISRGEDYYNNGYVINCVQYDDDFYATVTGSNNNCYDVTIYTDDYELIDFECTCPCEYPCKHIYATLMTIDNGDYRSYESKRCPR